MLIPVASGLPSVHDYLSRLDESRPLNAAEVSELSRLVVRFVVASQALLDYAECPPLAVSSGRDGLSWKLCAPAGMLHSYYKMRTGSDMSLSEPLEPRTCAKASNLLPYPWAGRPRVCNSRRPKCAIQIRVDSAFDSQPGGRQCSARTVRKKYRMRP